MTKDKSSDEVITNKELLKEILLENETFEEAIETSQFTSQTEALIQMLLGNNVYIGGPAGSGKSFLIKKYCEIVEKINPKINIQRTSTTGLSAINIGGKTIHSYSGSGIYNHTYEDYKNIPDIEKSGLYKSSRFKILSTNILIIDEVSMLSERAMDFLVKRIEDIKKISNIQIIVSGDFTQLPPVASKSNKEEYGEEIGNFCYNKEAWQKLNLSICYTDKIHRTQDERLKTLLEYISLGRGNTQTVKDIIKSIPITSRKYKKGTALLLSTNANVDKINEENHRANKGKLFKSETFIDKNTVQDSEAYAYKELRLPKELKLKDGDTIMITSNISEVSPIVKSYYYNNKTGQYKEILAKPLMNGMIGTFGLVDAITKGKQLPTFISYDEERKMNIYYVFLEKNVYSKEEVTPEELKRRERNKDKIRKNLIKTLSKDEKKLYDERNSKFMKEFELDVEEEYKDTYSEFSTVLARAKQYPMKLAYAISIHKSQGQSFDKVTADISNCWMPGLGYVALSRATSLDGLSLLMNNNRVINTNAILVSEESVEIKKDIMRKAHKLREDNLEFYKSLFDEKVILTDLIYQYRRQLFSSLRPKK